MTNTSGRVIAVLMLAAVAVALPSEHVRAQTPDPAACTVPIARPLRAAHISGNCGTNEQAVERVEPERPRPPDPLEFITYLKDTHANWIAIFVALHYTEKWAAARGVSDFSLSLGGVSRVP